MWIPKWLGEAYSKLYSKFGADVFTFNQAQEVLGLKKGLLNVIFSKLHSLRILFIHERKRPRLYRLIKPENFILMAAGEIRNLQAIKQERYIQLICDVARELIQLYPDISICIYGSMARGSARHESDLDMLVVSDRFKGSKALRVEELSSIEEKVSDELSRLRKYGIYTSLSFYPLRRDEAIKMPLIMLDIAVDGIIIRDDGFLEKVMSTVRERLAKLGARRVFLSDGSWYWDLKPEYVFGEVIDI